MSEPKGWAVVATFARVYEAEIAKARLESAGIPAQVLGEHIGVFGPGWAGMAIRGVRLAVPAPLLDEAVDVLGEADALDDAEWEDGWEEEDWDDVDDVDLEEDVEDDEDEPAAGEEWRTWGEWGPGAG